jgi:hypothetical protein
LAIAFAGNMDFAWQHISVLRSIAEFCANHPVILGLAIILAGVVWLTIIVHQSND